MRGDATAFDLRSRRHVFDLNNPITVGLRRASAQRCRLAAEFGLMPASRCRRKMVNFDF
jgi:hypothetical protein